MAHLASSQQFGAFAHKYHNDLSDCNCKLQMMNKIEDAARGEKERGGGGICSDSN